jgi:hypothetical protein
LIGEKGGVTDIVDNSKHKSGIVLAQLNQNKPLISGGAVNPRGALLLETRYFVIVRRKNQKSAQTISLVRAD